MGADLLGERSKRHRASIWRIRDSSAGNIAQLVSELAQEGAQVIVTPPTKAEATQVSAEAENSGCWRSALARATPRQPARFSFCGPIAVEPKHWRSISSKSGLQTVAILAPNTGYGQAMSRAFAETLQGSAVKTVADLSFADGATTFLAEVQNWPKRSPMPCFAGFATQLELISSQLAAGGVVGTYRVSRGPDGEPQQNGQRIKLILSSAEGMGERLLRSAGRYLQGRFWPLSVGQLAVTGGQVARLEYGSGEEPTSLDALGFDAVRLLRLACQRLGTGFVHGPRAVERAARAVD